MRTELIEIESVSLQKQVEQYINKTGRKKKWIAEQLGISPALFSQWLSGKTAFPYSRISAITELIARN